MNREATVASNQRRRGVPKPNHKPRYTKTAFDLANESARRRQKNGRLPYREPDPAEVVALWNGGTLQGEIGRLLNARGSSVAAILDAAGITNRRNRPRSATARAHLQSAQQTRRAMEPSLATRMRHRFGPRVGREIGTCAICGQTGQVVRDHDHVRLVPRDWLCPKCNVGLGFFGEDPVLLAAAVAYLRRHAGQSTRE